LASTPRISFIHSLRAYCSWSGNPHIKTLSSPVCNHDCYNISAYAIDPINPQQARTSLTVATIPSMGPLPNEMLQRIANLQARLFVKENRVILDKNSIDWMYTTSHAFLLFLERSENRTIADLLWAIEEGNRVEYIMKMFQQQIRYLKKRKEYSMSSLRSDDMA